MCDIGFPQRNAVERHSSEKLVAFGIALPIRSARTRRTLQSVPWYRQAPNSFPVVLFRICHFCVGGKGIGWQKMWVGRKLGSAQHADHAQLCARAGACLEREHGTDFGSLQKRHVIDVDGDVDHVTAFTTTSCRRRRGHSRRCLTFSASKFGSYHI